MPKTAPLIPALPREPVGIELPGGDPPAAAQRILQRIGIAVALVVFVAGVTYVDRAGYVDAADDGVSLLDAFYYATVTVTTTGYGDIRPESESARLISTILVTPARVLFLIVLVGTTLELLAEHTRVAYRKSRWRASLSGHTVIVGFGSKGRAAAQELTARGLEAEKIVVIETDPQARVRAVAHGYAVVEGDGTRTDVLREAGVATADAVIIAPSRDDSAVLMTLTVRELNADARVAAGVREPENAHLLTQSGADTVITAAGAAGRLLGMATTQPDVVRVLEDLLVSGDGLELKEHAVLRDGTTHAEAAEGAPILAVVRDGWPHRFDSEEVATLRAGDRVVCLCRHD